MKVTVKITKDILERSAGCKADMNLGINCAIGLAVHELLPNSYTQQHKIHVFESKAAMVEELHNTLCITREMVSPITIKLPLEAVDFIATFDNLIPKARLLLLTPMSFEIDVPNELIDQIGIGQVYKILSESKTLEMVMN